MGRTCAVRNCSNGVQKLKRWREQDCLIHGSKYGFGKCVCFQPFYLFGFPSEARDPDARKRWIRLVNRKGINRALWQPKAHDRVCSEHFIDREPTLQNPDPTLKLGYFPPLIPREITKRKLPKGDPNGKLSKIVCSQQVFSREPSAEDPHPTLKLGYFPPLIPREITKRKLPKGDPNGKLSKIVCSQRVFDRGPSAEDPHPTLKLGCSSHSTSKEKELLNGNSDSNTKGSLDSETFVTSLPTSSCHSIQEEHNYDFSSYVCTCKPSCSCTGCQHKQVEIQKLRHENELLQVQNAINEEQLKTFGKGGKLPFPQSILKTDKQVRDFTGLPSKAALLQLHNTLKDEASKMRYLGGKKKTMSTKVKKKSSLVKNSDKKLGRKRKLTTFEELVLVLMKLRLAIPLNFLGSLFNTNQSTCSSIFNTWITVFELEKKLQNFTCTNKITCTKGIKNH